MIAQTQTFGDVIIKAPQHPNVLENEKKEAYQTFYFSTNKNPNFEFLILWPLKMLQSWAVFSQARLSVSTMCRNNEILLIIFEINKIPEKIILNPSVITAVPRCLRLNQR